MFRRLLSGFIFCERKRRLIPLPTVDLSNSFPPARNCETLRTRGGRFFAVLQPGLESISKHAYKRLADEYEVAINVISLMMWTRDNVLQVL
jgi:hypothetical protein